MQVKESQGFLLYMLADCEGSATIHGTHPRYVFNRKFIHMYFLATVAATRKVHF